MTSMAMAFRKAASREWPASRGLPGPISGRPLLPGRPSHQNESQRRLCPARRNIENSQVGIGEVVPRVYRQSFPLDGIEQIVELSQTVPAPAHVNFRNIPLLIAGKVTSAGAAVPNWELFLDLNRNGQLDSGEPDTKTDATALLLRRRGARNV